MLDTGLRYYIVPSQPDIIDTEVKVMDLENLYLVAKCDSGKLYCHGPSCSKLTMPLVKVLLNFDHEVWHIP